MTTGTESRARLDDPLSPVGSRFTLSRSTTVSPPINDAKPSPPDVRPYGLRGAEERNPHVSQLGYRYCPDRQVAVMLAEPAEPLHEQVAGWTHTTIGNKDGNDPAQEDWKMDPTYTEEP